VDTCDTAVCKHELCGRS